MAKNFNNVIEGQFCLSFGEDGSITYESQGYPETTYEKETEKYRYYDAFLNLLRKSGKHRSVISFKEKVETAMTLVRNGKWNELTQKDLATIADLVALYGNSLVRSTLSAEEISELLGRLVKCYGLKKTDTVNKLISMIRNDYGHHLLNERTTAAMLDTIHHSAAFTDGRFSKIKTQKLQAMILGALDATDLRKNVEVEKLIEAARKIDLDGLKKQLYSVSSLERAEKNFLARSQKSFDYAEQMFESFKEVEKQYEGLFKDTDKSSNVTLDMLVMNAAPRDYLRTFCRKQRRKYEKCVERTRQQIPQEEIDHIRGLYGIVLEQTEVWKKTYARICFENGLSIEMKTLEQLMASYRHGKA